MQIELKVSGLDQAIKLMDDGNKMAKKVLDMAIQKSAQLAVRNIKTETPVDTGNLRRGIRADYYPMRASIWPHDAPYAIFVHEGTKYIKNANPFMDRGISNSENDINEIFKMAMDTILGE